ARLDEARSVIVRRIAECATGARLADRLRRLALRDPILHLLRGSSILVDGEREARGDEADHAARPRDVAIAVLEFRFRQPLGVTVAEHHLDGIGDAPGLAAVRTRVHRQRAADRSWNPGEEPAAGELRIDGELREPRAMHAGLGI